VAAIPLLTSHARVLLGIATSHRTRLRDLAERAGITERAAQAIVNDLVDAGYVTRHRLGTRSYYEVHPDAARSPRVAGDIGVDELLALVSHPPRPGSGAR
jgi:hypothetical protein